MHQNPVMQSPGTTLQFQILTHETGPNHRNLFSRNWVRNYVSIFTL